MTSGELRTKFLEFFEKRGHKVIPSASLVPENDPTVLFTTAGMHPLVPYLLGEKHPAGNRLTNAQKCFRTGDIEEVGDETHHTFFEMLGNWSLGEYFKKEAIEYSFEFLTSPEWLGIEKDKLAVSVFAGDEDAPFDQEAYDKWIELGISPDRIVKLGKEDNWWGPAGETGPCGPDTEMFYWKGSGSAPKKFDPEESTKTAGESGWVEIWNDVFMQYEKKKRTILVDGMDCLYDENFVINEELLNVLNSANARKILVVNGFREKAREALKGSDFEFFSCEEEGIKKDNTAFFEKLMSKYQLSSQDLIYFDHAEENINSAKSLGIVNALYQDSNQVKKFIEDNIYQYKPLAQKNVDTGMGLERTLAVLNGLDDNYKTELFWPIIEKIEEISGKKYEDNKKAFRIIADHIKAAVFAISDGVVPSNKGAGYIVRRLIRRSIVKAQQLGIAQNFTKKLAEKIFEIYSGVYNFSDNTQTELEKEEDKFRNTLNRGLKEFEIVKDNVSGEVAFNLYQTFGFPWEMTVELAEEHGIKVDKKEFESAFSRHQELSRTASAGMFKGGLADAGETAVKYHTATHLLMEALRRVLDPNIIQKGSNITAERIRLDFNYPEKLTPEQIKKVEDLVNEQIERDLPVTMEEMALDEAKKSGAQGVFDHKYGNKVKVYTIGPLTRDSSTPSGRSEPPFSREICGGPHVGHLGELGHFKIKKEESSSAGVRRIKAVLE